MKGNLYAMAAMMAAMSEAGSYTERTPNREVIKHPPKKVIPKGCKEYFFNKFGGIYNRKEKYQEYVFECVATSEKSAIRKYKNFINRNPQP